MKHVDIRPSEILENDNLSKLRKFNRMKLRLILAKANTNKANRY